MSMSKKYLMTVMVLAFVAVFLCCNGCKKSGKESSKDGTTGSATNELSTKCNQTDHPKCPVEEFAQTHKYPAPEKHK